MLETIIKALNDKNNQLKAVQDEISQNMQDLQELDEKIASSEQELNNINIRINGKDNLNVKTNTAEISEDKNEYDVPDRDSTPDNRKDGEDDIDIAKVILAITTGAAKTYLALTTGLLAIVLVGVVHIKKIII